MDTLVRNVSQIKASLIVLLELYESVLELFKVDIFRRAMVAGPVVFGHACIIGSVDH